MIVGVDLVIPVIRLKLLSFVVSIWFHELTLHLRYRIVYGYDRKILNG